MSEKKKRMALDMANGMDNTAIAMLHGVSPSYVSNLKQDPNFVSQLDRFVSIKDKMLGMDEGVVDRQDCAQVLDDLWDSLELSTLEKLENMAAEGMIKRPADLLKLLTAANNAKRKTPNVFTGKVNDGAAANNVVVLSIPIAAMQAAGKIETVLNDRNQVVEIDGRALVNMSIEEIDRASAIQRGDEIEDLELPELLTPEQVANKAQLARDQVRAEIANEVHRP